jgi:hypothetical protein
MRITSTQPFLYFKFKCLLTTDQQDQDRAIYMGLGATSTSLAPVKGLFGYFQFIWIKGY